MKILKIVIAAAVAMTMSIGADEYDNKYYVGLLGSINQTTARNADIDIAGYGGEEFTNAGLGINAGMELLRHKRSSTFVEVRVLKSFFMEASEDISTTSYAIYLKPKLEVLKHLHVYALIGASGVTYREDKAGDTSSGYGISGGIGGELEGRKNLSFTADVIWNADDTQLHVFEDKVTHANFTLGLLYRF